MTTDSSARRPPLVPPEIAWPGFIVFLLALSIAMGVAAVVAATSDGGQRPVEVERTLVEPTAP